MGERLKGAGLINFRFNRKWTQIQINFLDFSCQNAVSYLFLRFFKPTNCICVLTGKTQKIYLNFCQLPDYPEMDLINGRRRVRTPEPEPAPLACLQVPMRRGGGMPTSFGDKRIRD